MRVAVLCLTMLLLASLSAPVVARAADGPCSLSPADKLANAALSFDEFDQMGTSPSTWRQLSKRKCEREAIEAAEDYLVHGPLPTEAERKVITFHIGQTLGFLDKFEAAALMVASSKNLTQSVTAELDWNTYVQGTWAFFKRNQAELTEMRDRLAMEPGSRNGINAAVLTGLVNCFAEPYAVAYEQPCRVGAGNARN
jgi:hypothetical protein